MLVAEKHHPDRIRASARLFHSLGPPLLLFVIYVGFFWKLTLTRQYTWLESPDFANQVLPWYQFEAGEFHQGHFPLWDPYLWGGQPLLGQVQPGLSYPFNWIFFSLPLRHGWIRIVYMHWYFVLIHYMGGLFCFWLCRDLKRSTLASLFAGAAFGIGGYMGTTDWPMMLNGAVWAPLVFRFFFRVFRGESPGRNAAYSGACLGMAFLSGHHQIPIFISLAIGGCWVFFLYQHWRIGRILDAAKTAAIFGLFVSLVSGFIMLPAVEYGKLAIRWVGASHAVGWKEAVPYPVHEHFSLFPASILGIVLPGIAVNAIPYIGWVVVTLAILGLAAYWRLQEVRMLGAVSLGGLLFSLAHYNVFHGMIYAIVPMVEKARSASMAIFIFHFATISLSAYGIDALLDSGERYSTWPTRIMRVLLVAAGALAMFVLVLWTLQIKTGEAAGFMMAALAATFLGALLYGWKTDHLSARATGVLLILLMLLEQGIVTGAGYRNRDQPEYLLKKMSENADIVTFLRSQPVPVRVELDDTAIQYNFGDWQGIDEFGGYLASLTTNVDRVQSNYWGRMLYATNFWLGTKPRWGPQIELFTGATGLKIYSNSEAFPRIWTVHRAVSIQPWQTDAKLDAGGPALRREAFLIGEAPKLDACAGTDQAALVTREANRILLESDMACKGMVVAAETFFPGWKATVDGRPERIWEVYGALRGVIVPAGKHRVEMVYRPASVLTGATMTACGLLGILLITLPWRRRTGVPDTYVI